MIKRLAFLAVFIAIRGTAQTLPKHPLKTGDLLFQDLDCGPLCDAIEEVTQSYQGKRFSHLGMVYLRNDSTYLIEAIGKEVQLTPLTVFAARTKKPMFVGRVRDEQENIIPAATDFALKQLGVPYDDEFLYNNGKYYCSELIFDAFREANGRNDFFKLEPMTFRKPGSQAYFPVWITYYKKLGIPIPEAKPGINPGGISTSSLLQIMPF